MKFLKKFFIYIISKICTKSSEELKQSLEDVKSKVEDLDVEVYVNINNNNAIGGKENGNSNPESAQSKR